MEERGTLISDLRDLDELSCGIIKLCDIFYDMVRLLYAENLTCKPHLITVSSNPAVLPHQQTSQQQQQAQSMTAPHYQVLSPTTDLSQGMEQATICSRGNILQQNSMPPGALSVPHSKSLRHNDDDDEDTQQVKSNMYQHGQINSLPQAFEKKLRRLEKNRESARECRRRKKEHVVELQKQVAHLEAENLKLKLQLKVGEESQAQERQEKARITKKLDEMVRLSGELHVSLSGRESFGHEWFV